ncbi:MAG TPA: hypothetical protein VF595_13275 [Tepidisphaeraceae bacterium]|jgi:hypothetical protein
MAATPYDYDTLQRVPGCVELIGHLAGLIWRMPDAFETDLVAVPERLELRWQSTAPTAGLMTLRWGVRVVSITVLASGLNPDADELTINALQQQLVHQLHGTEYEASFALRELTARPLAATLNITTPADPSLQSTAAVADRCFAAAYFRYLRLA